MIKIGQINSLEVRAPVYSKGCETKSHCIKKPHVNLARYTPPYLRIYKATSSCAESKTSNYLAQSPLHFHTQKTNSKWAN